MAWFKRTRKPIASAAFEKSSRVPERLKTLLDGGLPDGFQRSEFLLEHGLLDMVVDRRELRSTLGRARRFMHADAIPATPIAAAPAATAAAFTSSR
jgi:acetyl-CoA carboxylase beta subunit